MPTLREELRTLLALATAIVAIGATVLTPSAQADPPPGGPIAKVVVGGNAANVDHPVTFSLRPFSYVVPIYGIPTTLTCAGREHRRRRHQGRQHRRPPPQPRRSLHHQHAAGLRLLLPGHVAHLEGDVPDPKQLRRRDHLSLTATFGASSPHGPIDFQHAVVGDPIVEVLVGGSHANATHDLAGLLDPGSLAPEVYGIPWTLTCSSATASGQVHAGTTGLRRRSREQQCQRPGLPDVPQHRSGLPTLRGHERLPLVLNVRTPDGAIAFAPEPAA